MIPSERDSDEAGRLPSEQETVKLIRQLEIHQAELEMQNDELRHAWAVSEVAVNKYTELYDFAPSGYFTLSRDGKIMGLNLCGANLVGNDRVRLKSSAFDLYLSQDTRAVFKIFLENIFVNRTLETCEVILQPDGKAPVHLHLSGIVAEGGQQCLVNAIDITNRKMAEEALHESERLLRESQQVARLGSYVWDVSVNLWTSSKILDEIFGIDEHYVRSFEGWTMIIHPDFRDSMADYVVNEVIGQHHRFDREYKIVRQTNGQECWVHGLGQLVLDSGNQPVKLIGTITDITDRKKAEAFIQLSNEQLQAANAEKDKFFSIIAHDLRSPFNAFLGLTRIMVEDLPTLTLDEIQHIALTMRNSANNLFNLLENLLDWAKIQQGIIAFNPETVELAQVINDSLVMVYEQAKNKGIEIASPVNDGSTVYADVNILQTIIRNLVANAVKFTQKGGKVTLSTWTNSVGGCEVSVIDNGIGMTGDMVENLFRIDFKTCRRGTDGESGTGLGLIICRDLVKKHNGKLWVESEDGKGSAFRFSLPPAPRQE